MKVIPSLTPSAWNTREIHDMNRFLQRTAGENPFFLAALALCPLLAGTDTAAHGLILGLATLAVLAPSQLVLTLLESRISRSVRTAAHLINLAVFATLVHWFLAATAPGLFHEIEASLALVVVSCLILGQADSKGAANLPDTLMNALSAGAVFAVGATAFGALRELLGTGGVWGYNLLGAHIEPWVVFTAPTGGLLLLGAALVGFNEYRKRATFRALTAAPGARETL